MLIIRGLPEKLRRELRTASPFSTGQSKQVSSAPALRDSAYVEPADAREIKDDPLYDEAVRFVLETRRPSISAVQRKLKIGYNRAARFLEAMEQFGVVTPMNTDGSREVLG